MPAHPASAAALPDPADGPHPPAQSSDGRRRRIPLWVKVAYSVYVAVLVPCYWRVYGPLNFLFFCDVALLLTLVALWTESRLLASMQAVAILLPQTVWVIDFVVRLFGGRLLGMTDYMFNPGLPLFVRLLSSFHGWLPFLLLWMVWRLGYDRRALWLQTAFGLALLIVSYLVSPAPPAPADNPNAAVNINYVFGLSDQKPQTWMPGWLWFMFLLLIVPVGLYLPAHLLLSRLFARPAPAADGTKDSKDSRPVDVTP
jgi:hypothetical protein